jgi:hypothetical protein
MRCGTLDVAASEGSSMSVPEPQPAAAAPAAGVIGLGAMGHCMAASLRRAGHAQEDDSAVIEIFPGITLPERHS